MHDDSNDPSFMPTPAETPLTGTSRVPTRDSQSSFSQPTKSRSPQHQTAPSTAPTSKPSSHDSVEERPHQVKFILSDSPESSPPSTPGTPGPVAPKIAIPDPNDPYRRSKRKPQSTNLAEIPDRFHFEKVTRKRQSQQLHYYDQPSAQPSSHHHHHHHHHGHSGLLHNLSSKSLKDLVKSGTHHDRGHESSGEELHDEHTGSQVSLRRFFRGAGAKKSSRPSTPVTPPAQPSVSHHTLPRPSTPPPRKSAEKKRSTMPFGDDHA